MSITERVRSTWSAISARRAARRQSRGEKELKRREARAHHDQLQHGKSTGRPDGGGVGGGGGF